MNETATIAPLIVQVLIAMLATIPPTMLAWAALKQGRANNAQGTETAAKVHENTMTTEATARKIDENTTTAAETARKVDVNTETTARTELKTDKIIDKAAEIHDLTNGNLSKMTAALAEARQEIKDLTANSNTIISDLQMSVVQLMAKISKDADQAEAQKQRDHFKDSKIG